MLKEKKETKVWAGGRKAGEVGRDRLCRAQWVILWTLVSILRPTQRNKRLLIQRTPCSDLWWVESKSGHREGRPKALFQGPAEALPPLYSPLWALLQHWSRFITITRLVCSTPYSETIHLCTFSTYTVTAPVRPVLVVEWRVGWTSIQETVKPV